MIILDTSSRSLEVDLAGAVTTNELPCIVCFKDKVDNSVQPEKGATQLTTTAGTTDTVICAAPRAGVSREILYVNIFNRDTVAATVIVRLEVGSGTWTLQSQTLQVNEALVYEHGMGWQVV